MKIIITGVTRPSPTKDFPIVLEGNGAMLDGLVGVDPLLGRDVGGRLFRFETSLGPTHTSDILFVDGKPAPLGAKRWATGMPQLDGGQFLRHGTAGSPIRSVATTTWIAMRSR